jgi:tetratricopeptide (TPR) repeat protein
MNHGASLVEQGPSRMTNNTSRRDPYADWPYATSYLFKTLDPDLIESHAVSILSRALNMGRVVGFIGAGVPMSYGRISWQNLVETEIERVTARYDRFKEAYAAEKKKDEKRRHFEDVQRLFETFSRLKLPRTDVQTDRYPMLFQVSEELDNALARIEDILQAENPTQPREMFESLRQHASALLVDDSGHAYQVMMNALLFDETGSKIPKFSEIFARGFVNAVLRGATDLATFRSKTATSPMNFKHRDLASWPPYHRRGYRLFFQRENVAELLLNVKETPQSPAAHEPTSRAFNAVKMVAHKILNSVGAGGHLLPTQRFIVGVLLALAPATERQTLAWWDKIAAQVDGAKEKVSPGTDGLTTRARVGVPVTRHVLAPQRRDPLLLLQDRLQVNRFLTTNYDGEIERLFDDQGFRRLDNPDSLVAASMTRPLAEDIVFDRSKAGVLVDFAVRDRGRSASVVHLHGKADEARPQQMIITEADYQKRYLGSDRIRGVLDNAISLAFGANPLLFVGSGMGEDDILRPLRQFMSIAPRGADRIAVALLPALESSEKRTEQKIALLGRYGVYAIHFGNAGIEVSDGCLVKDSCLVEAVWLPWIWSIKIEVRTILDEIIRPAKESESATDVQGRRKLKNFNQRNIQRMLEDGPELTRSFLENLSLKAPDAGPEEKGVISKQLRQRFCDRNGILNITNIEGCSPDVEFGIEIGAEIDLINIAAAFSSGVPLDPAPDEPTIRQARALRDALDGAVDSIMSVFTCARLIRVREDWKAWKTRWYGVPPARRLMAASPAGVLGDAAPPSADARGQGSLKTFAARKRLLASDAIIQHRHEISMPVSPEEGPRKGRFYSGAPSQSYFGLVAALRRQGASQFRLSRVRRILLLISERGVGKGHLFSALDECPADGAQRTGEERVFDIFDALSWDLNPDEQPIWIGAAFFNLSFSQEIMSVFDRLSDFLEISLSKLGGHDIAIREARRLQANRLQRLRFMLETWSALRKEVGRCPRLLIAINSLDLLFDRDGVAKNGQLKSIFELLIDAQYDKVPIDFLFACEADHVPAQFRRQPSASIRSDEPPAKVVERETGGEDELEGSSGTLLLIKPIVGAKEHAAAAARVKKLGLRLPRLAPDLPLDNLPQTVEKSDAAKKEKAWVAVHPLHPAPASIVATAYFPRVALLVARDLLKTLLLDDAARRRFEKLRPSMTYGQIKENYPAIFEPSSKAFRSGFRDGLEAFNPNRGVSYSLISSKRIAPAAIAMLVLMLEFRMIETDSELASEIRMLMTTYSEQSAAAEAATTGDTPAGEAAAKLAAQSLLVRLGTSDDRVAAVALLGRLATEFDARMKRLFNSVNGGRFLLTVLFSGAFESTSKLTHTGEKGAPESEVDEAMRRTYRFLTRLEIALQGVPSRRVADVVIEETLATMRRRADRGEPLPLRLDWGVPFEESADGTPEEVKPILHRMMTEIIWHLAIIGQPTEAVVLSYCPRIIEIHKAFSQAWPVGQCPAVNVVVREALALALNRCLIFKLGDGGEATQELHNPEADAQLGVHQRDRYAVHRLMQRHMFRSLGSPDVEFPNADQFALSLYASQPEEMPRLGLESHRAIKRTIEALTDYPGESLPENYPEGEAERHCLLRAAFGMMRTIYSVAVLARLDERSDDSKYIPATDGFFEEYRRMIRWLLMTSEEFSRDPLKDARPEAKNAPFYAEEIVWMFNECATLSLVEGRLGDAQALFELATTAALRIEPGSNNPLHVRIDLNKAVVDIERGQIGDAREKLRAIQALTNEHEVIPLLATGYLGLIDHIGGESEAAVKKYKAAIRGLGNLNRSRSVSIFYRHLGDLLSNLGENRRIEAWQCLESAVHFAQEGGHEDIRYLALLSRVKYRLQHDTADKISSIHKDLDGIERYARVVGMPRILADVSLTRSRLLQRQGETEQASQLATEGLQIATINDMRQRKVSGLLLLAQINSNRGYPGVARPILSLATRMAKAFGNHYALTAGQALGLQLAADDPMSAAGSDSR